MIEKNEDYGKNKMDESNVSIIIEKHASFKNKQINCILAIKTFNQLAIVPRSLGGDKDGL